MAQKANMIEEKDIASLLFDPENPRLPAGVDGGSQAAVLEWLLKDASIPELMGSIGEHGYFAGEPLLITAAGGQGVYYVVEGNRRLASLKLLHEPELAPIKKKTVQQIASEAKSKPNKIPCLEFAKREDILAYLGYRHITGIKPWSSLAKAKYLRQLSEKNPGLSFTELAKQIGSRADYVARLLTAYSLYETIEESAFFGIDGLDDETISFSLITTAINYSNILTFLGLSSSQDTTLKGLKKGHLKHLTSWFFAKDAKGDTAIGESRNIGKLNAVVSHDKARKAFENKEATLDEAYLLTGAPTDGYRAFIEEARDKLEKAQGQIHLITDLENTDLEAVKEISTLVRQIYFLVSAKMLSLPE